MSPLVPTVLDGAAMSVCVIGLLLALAALASPIRAASPTGWHLLAWALVVLFVPFVGPVSWFAVRLGGRRQRLRHLDDNAWSSSNRERLMSRAASAESGRGGAALQAP